MFRIINESGPGPAELQLYGPITAGAAARLRAQLRPLAQRRVEVHINSGGGDYHEGIAIHNVLRQHPGGVTTVVDGFAGSAASLVAMAGDRILMARGSSLLIHDCAIEDLSGNASMVGAAAVALAAWSNNAAQIYASRAGRSAEYWRSLMVAETTFTADEAVRVGLADDVVDGRVAVTAFARRRLVYTPSNSARPGLQLSMFNMPAMPGRGDWLRQVYARRSLQPSTLAAVWLGLRAAFTSPVGCAVTAALSTRSGRSPGIHH